MARGAIPILKVGSTLLATVHIDLRDAVADAFQEDVLLTIEKTGASGLLIDISGLDMVERPVTRAEAGKGPRETEDLVVSVVRGHRVL